jgi:putative transposase
MGCDVKIINGVSDHVHCLFNINAKRSLDEIIKMVKGASSHKINQEENLIIEKFAWEKGYDSSGVGKTELDDAFKKILNQKSLHSDPSFTVAKEINEMHAKDIE